MQTVGKNPCVRCGKERVLVKTWTKMIGLAETVFTLTACPDPECQKQVDKQNAERERKRLLHLKPKPPLKQGGRSQLTLK